MHLMTPTPLVFSIRVIGQCPVPSPCFSCSSACRREEQSRRAEHRDAATGALEQLLEQLLLAGTASLAGTCQ